MAIQTGVNVSKGIAYALVGSSLGVNVSKANAYVITAAAFPGVDVSKANAYVVYYPIEGIIARPQLSVIT